MVLSLPAVSVVQPASTAIISIGVGDKICVRLPIGLKIFLALVVQGSDSPTPLGMAGSRRHNPPLGFPPRVPPSAATRGAGFAPKMVVGPPEDIEPRWQGMISGADGGDQFCC